MGGTGRYGKFFLISLIAGSVAVFFLWNHTLSLMAVDASDAPYTQSKDGL